MGRALKCNVQKFYDTLKDHELRKKAKEEEEDFPFSKIQIAPKNVKNITKTTEKESKRSSRAT